MKYTDPYTGQPLEEVAGGFKNPATNRIYPVADRVPRFCDSRSYADNFGDQWNYFQRTQLDLETRSDITKTRLWRGTEWNPDDLAGADVLEIGCGAGRFTGCFLASGANVWSTDLSDAVDACRKNHGGHLKHHVAQADVYHLPFPLASFDYVFMYGVLQHTPDPWRTVACAVNMARPGGRIAVDVYAKIQGATRWNSKYRWRWVTKRLPPRILRRLVSWYIPRWLPIDDWLGKICPSVQAWVASIIPCWNYRGIKPLPDNMLVAWAVLDTYDALGAKYDFPFTQAELADLLNSIPGIKFSIKTGGNGFEANILKL